MFERLHGQNEFEGNGIGLCIVQRILHRHEGDITITGQPGKGARVEFWLPVLDTDTSDARSHATTST